MTQPAVLDPEQVAPLGEFAAVASPTRRRARVGRWLALGFLALLLLTAVFGPWLYPYGPTEQALLDRLLAPGARGAEGRLHLLGTDALGRDVLAQLIYGARLSVSVAICTVVLSGVLGTTLGLYAGYVQGRFGALIMRTVDVMLAFPTLLLALVILFAVGPSFWAVVLVLAFARWTVFARVAEGLGRSAREETYVAAAKVLGCGTPRIMRRHVLPNVFVPLLILATLEVSIVIPAEAGLSFLGVGIQPPDTSWGLMIADARPYIETAWWLVAAPAAAILLTTLCVNVLAREWSRSR